MIWPCIPGATQKSIISGISSIGVAGLVGVAMGEWKMGEMGMNTGMGTGIGVAGISIASGHTTQGVAVGMDVGVAVEGAAVEPTIGVGSESSSSHSPPQSTSSGNVAVSKGSTGSMSGAGGETGELNAIAPTDKY